MRAFLNDFGLFVLRVVFGVIMFAHGVQKLFINDPQGGIGFFTKIGIPSPEIMFWVGALTELLGGIALILGILTRLAALGTAIVMGGAIAYVHYYNGFWNQEKGYEFALILCAVGVALMLTGPGRWSVDYLVVGRRAKKQEEAATVVSTTSATPLAVSPGAATATPVTPAPVIPTTEPTGPTSTLGDINPKPKPDTTL